MSRSKLTSNPISFHKHTKQYYVTRGGKRIYLGTDKEEALKKYHRLGLGIEPVQQETAPPVEIISKFASFLLKTYSRAVGFLRRCPVCDKRLVGNANYCGGCGSKV